MDGQIAFLVVWALLSQQAAGQVDKDWMRKTLSEHFSAPRHHVTNPAYKAAAMKFIRDQFRELGLEAHVHTFSTLQPDVTGVNVIGLLKGRNFNTPDDSVTGIAAHYDTMRNTPGVNDNGAAVVAMLQAARELSKQPVRNGTVIFLAFDFEESESSAEDQVACSNAWCGSSALVTQWLPVFLSVHLTWKGVIVMDTILNFDSAQNSQTIPSGGDELFPEMVQDVSSDGKRGDFLLIAGRQYDEDLVMRFKDKWNTQGESQYEIEALVLPAAIPNPVTLEMLRQDVILQVARSDHSTFWVGGYRAVFITDTANFRGYMQQCYHSKCDNLTYVTDAKIGFIAKTARTLVAVVDSMAPPENDSMAPPENDSMAPPANDSMAPPANDSMAPPANGANHATDHGQTVSVVCMVIATALLFLRLVLSR